MSNIIGYTKARMDALLAAVVQRANHTGTQPASSIDGLAPVATSGAYTDLKGVPSLAGFDAAGAAQAAQGYAVQRANHTGTQPVSTISGLAAVATSGSYADLSSKPTFGTAAAQPTTAFDAAGTAAAAQAAAINSAATAAANLYAPRAGGSVGQVVATLPYYNVRDYGAKGDYSTDDTAAFTAALAAAANGGGTVLVPAGTYSLRPNVIKMLNGRVRLMGVGRGSVLSPVAGPGTLIQVGQDGVQPSDVSIENLSIVGQGANGSRAGAVDIWWYFFHSARMSNIRSINTGAALRIGNSNPAQQSAILHAVNLQADAYTDYYAWIMNVIDPYLRQVNTISAIATAASGIVIDSGTVGGGVSDGDIIGGGGADAARTGTGLLIRDLAGCNGPPRWIDFSALQIDSFRDGAVIGTGYGMRFWNCWFSNRPGIGITVSGGEDHEFVACRIENNGTHGVVLNSGASRTKFIGCTSVSNSASNAGNHGFVIADKADHFTLQGCTAYNGQRAILGASQAYGIFFVGAATNFQVIGCDFTGNGTGTSTGVPTASPTQVYAYNLG